MKFKKKILTNNNQKNGNKIWKIKKLKGVEVENKIVLKLV